MATIALNYYCDLNQAVKVQYIDGNVFSGDNAGNTISVYVMDGDQPATIGGSVSADVIRADGSTVAVSGALDGNRAYVILPQACYAVPGSISIVIKNTQNTTITTIAALVGNVYRSSTDEIVDPGTIIPSISSLIAAIDAAIGSIPADYSALLASIAADYSSSKTYPVGAYCWEAGVLKRCIVPITSAETYTAAHWTNAVIGDDLSALKSAITNDFKCICGVFNKLDGVIYVDNKYLDASGVEHESSNYHYTDYIPVKSGKHILYIDRGASGVALRVHGYNASKVWTSQIAINNEAVTGEYGIEFVVTSESYIRISTDKRVKLLVLQNGDSLKENITELKTAAEIINAIKWTLPQNRIVQGTYSANSHEPYRQSDNSARIRYGEFLPVLDGSTIRFTPGTNAQQMLIIQLKNGVYVRESSWYTTSSVITIPSDANQIVPIFKRTNGNNITPSEYDAIVVVDTITAKAVDGTVETIGITENELKRSIDIAGSIGWVLPQTNIIQGTYSSGSTAPGKWASSSTRIRNNGFIYVSKGQSIHFVPGTNAAKMVIGFFKDETFVRDSSTYSTETIVRIPSDSNRIILVFKKTDESASITPSDFDATVTISTIVAQEIQESETIVYPTFESGSFNENTGAKRTLATRIRCANEIYVTPLMRIIAPEGYSVLAFQYDANGSYIGYNSGGYQHEMTKSKLSDEAYKINIAIRKDDSPYGDISDKIAFISDNIVVDFYAPNHESIGALTEGGVEYQTIQYEENYYNNDAVSQGKKIDSDGMEESDADYKCTDYISIPTKYGRPLNYSFAFTENGYTGVTIAFYDEQKTHIENDVPDGAVSTPDNAYYVKVVFPVSAEKCSVNFSTESIVPQYVKPRKYLTYQHDLFSYDKNIVSDGAMTAMAKTALKYINNPDYKYGTAHTAFSDECIWTTKDEGTAASSYEGEAYQVDCSTFVQLILMGIVPECSRYLSDLNIPADYGFRFNGLVEYEGYMYGEKRETNSKPLYANSIAKYAYKNGYLFNVDDGLKNIRPGDILFWGNQAPSYDFFENIGHVGFVFEVVRKNDGTAYIQTFESNGGSGACCGILRRVYRDSLLDYAARFPIPYVHSTAKKITNFTTPVSETVSGNASESVKIADIQLAEPLKTGNVYTIHAKGSLPENCRYLFATGGISEMGLVADFEHRPDGDKTIRVAIPTDVTLTTENTISVYCKFIESGSGIAGIDEFDVYDGFVTPPIL